MIQQLNGCSYAQGRGKKYEIYTIQWLSQMKKVPLYKLFELFKMKAEKMLFSLNNRCVNSAFTLNKKTQ